MSNTSSVRDESHMTTHTSGWLSFAGYLLIVVAFFHLIAGLVALFQPELYITSPNNTLLFSYDQWGWTHIIFGAILMATAASLFSGRLWARIFTIVLATLSAIANFAFIWAYPLWAIMIVALDILVIYGVAMHGNPSEEYE